ncbi:PP2C family protein-serine/threonine phosphatase [Vibrio fortis]|uniref:PP2C family protein-serine/threonine phosphatase n=1 Tax=Vibrio fortis TaxID=212667 RepID=UPI0038CD1777
MLKVKFQYSDIGHRNENLDRFGHIEKDHWSFSYVIDGFDIKTPHYVDSLKDQLDKLIELPSSSSEEQILKAITHAINFENHFSGKASIALAICLPTKIITLTAGDTRIYRLDSLERTLDHSRAQEMINIGRAKVGSLYKHPLRKYLIKKLEPGCSIDVLTIDTHQTIEDIMICSDGVWSCFSSDDELYQAISEGHDVFTEQALSNRQTNRDNMTILWLQA